MLFGTALASTPARADLFADGDALYARLAQHYAVHRLGPRVLEQGGTLPAAPSLPMSDDGSAGCATVIVLGPPNASFTLRMGDAGALERRSTIRWETESVAGLADVMRCGSRRRELRHLAVEMRSPRAAVERYLVISEGPLPRAFRYLPSREPSPPQPESSVPVRVSIAAQTKRIALAKQSYTVAGAEELESLGLEASVNGSGEVTLPFNPGCYRLRLFAADPPPALLLDAQLSWPDGDAPPSGDRLESLDVELRACVVRHTSARLRFVGAKPGQPLAAVRARFPLPQDLSAHWGAEGAAALALALHEQQALPPSGVPVFDSLGSGGATVVHLDVIPGACYVAAVAPLREMTAPIVLAAQLGIEHRQNSSPAEGVGTAIAFCAPALERIPIEVESSPRESMWLLGIWQVSSDSSNGGGG